MTLDQVSEQLAVAVDIAVLGLGLVVFLLAVIAVRSLWSR